MKTAGIIAAAGKGSRFGGTMPKQFVKVNGKEVLVWACLNFEREKAVEGYVITVSPDFREITEKLIKKHKLRKVIGTADGGAERQHSVRNSLNLLKPYSPDNVLIHDGARPVFEKSLCYKVIKALEKYKAAVPVKKINQTVKVIDGGIIKSTIDRDTLRTSETPQGYRFKELIRLYNKKAEGKIVTDEAALFEAAGFKVAAIEDTGFNIKITTKQDMDIFRAYLKSGELK